MEWFEKEHSLPEPGKSVIVYSPVYDTEDDTVDDSLLFRIIDSRFISIAREATHWAYIEAPRT